MFTGEAKAFISGYRMTEMIAIYSLLIFYAGSLITSFLHLVALRLPIGESINGLSKCDACKHKLKLYEVLPLIGFVINRGRCRYCSAKIDWIYPVLEVIGGLLYMAAYLYWGFSWEFAVAIVAIAVLMAESISDAYYMIVIDRIWIFGSIILIVIRIADQTILDHLLSAFVLFAIMLLIAFVGKKIYKQDAFGGGDVKLFIFIGLCLMIAEGILALMIASLLGMIYGFTRRSGRKAIIPLVPFIAVGSMIALFFGEAIIQWYFTLLGM
ncbi:MAG: prepilin peptidase [Bacilli bacterium]|nr:prepilin peptidase [Bacilli bacterium]